MTNPEAQIYAAKMGNLDNVKRWYWDERSRRTVESLKRNGFTALYVTGIEEARREILERIPAGASVGVGGSVTIRQLGILPALAEKGHRIFDHWVPELGPDERMAVRRSQLTSDVFLTSANAITMSGQIVSIDSAGNRAAAMIFGPGKVIIAAGANKITRDLNAALDRARDVATPQVLKDTGLVLPCTETGSCQECRSSYKGCGVTVILERMPGFTDTIVVLIGEALGF